MSLGKVARQLFIPRGSVSGIVRRYHQQQSAQSRPRKPRPLHPNSITDSEFTQIHTIVEANHFISAFNLIQQARLCCSRSTLSRTLRRVGIQHQKAFTRPYLTPISAAKRLAFAERWLGEIHAEAVLWPPYSSDLNPIENIWKVMKDRIIVAQPSLRTMPDSAATSDLLLQTAEQVWNNLDQEVTDGLIMSFRKRLEAIKAARGLPYKISDSP